MEVTPRYSWVFRCFVVVGDRRGPAEYNISDVRGHIVFLDVPSQEELPYASMEHIPWNHFGRKNVGYLYAIQHGAKIIYDTDDDNKLITGQIPQDRFFGVDAQIQLKQTSAIQRAYNPYLDFISANPWTGERVFSWPRGLPLESIRDPISYSALDSDRSVFAVRASMRHWR